MKLTLLEEKVKGLYEELEIQTPRDLDMQEICSKLNIKFKLWDYGSEAGTINNKPYICIDKRLNFREQWGDFGHELGHIIKHCGNQKHLPATFVEYQEIQANHFAEHFLVPTFILNRINFPPFPCEENIFYLMKLFPVDRTIAKKRLLQYSTAVFEANLNRTKEVWY
ncbi:ImmA/IrrE family metallo-endopeptidase [Listeria fleischmannii]|uniref:Phage-like element PBSX protein n=1 Tax=Listeria fleischmannii FSL S10-1203 TaxID=1265822 RepID=W7DIR5_9LIST|nr:ImmA/IrrE family metallo-endopeptidase [Listeria fleischmannii]EUJ64819.1 phage-like element PBSX protein [Listeria fleischmannii FSL S10-1203]